MRPTPRSLSLLAPAAVLALSGCANGGVDTAMTVRTTPSPTVTVHHRWTPPATHPAPVPGRCFYESLSDPGRPDAWRCMTGNLLLDPCVPAPGSTDVVLCPATPDGPVRAVRLTAPLPARSPESAPVTPWALRLKGGTECLSIGGGMAPLVAGRPASYFCGPAGRDGWVVGDLDTHGRQWQADLVPPGARQPTTVAVTDTWS